MTLRVGEIISFLESEYPPQLAAEWDNCGLQLGLRGQLVQKILVSLELDDAVVAAAKKERADLIITHHPMIFRGIKRVDFDTYLGRNIKELCSLGASVYSLHTNLDRAQKGLNTYLAEVLGIGEPRSFAGEIEIPNYKLVVFVPESHLEEVRRALGDAGAGFIGRYSHCTFASHGEGTFIPGEGTNPFIGSQGEMAKVAEYRLETIVPRDRLSAVLLAMHKAHPYEEVAYDVYPLAEPSIPLGFGRWGILEEPTSLGQLARRVKEKLGLSWIRVIGQEEDRVRRVGVVSGSGAEFIGEAARIGLDVLITGDVRYHDARQACELRVDVIDAGHDGLEQVMVDLVAGRLEEAFPGRAEVLRYKPGPLWWHLT